MKYQINAYTTKHFNKVINEDSILVNDCVLSDGFYSKKCDLDEFIYAVCDGVSGSDKGYFASSYVLQSIANANYNNKDDLKHLLYDINQSFKDVGEKVGSYDLSTTFAAIYYNNGMNIYSVGDSRIYKVKDGKVTLLTQDDSLAYQLYLDNVITYDEIFNHPKKNVLVKYFGNNDEQFKIQTLQDDDYKNALYIIMSDGISDYIEPSKLEEIMTKNIDGFDMIRLIIGEAVKNNSNDDISIIVLEAS